MAETDTKKWYVVRAISGSENKVKDYIEKELAHRGVESYVDDILVPKEKVMQVRNGKKISKEKVFFPGYIMINANLEGELPHIIKDVNGVIGFLGETKGGEPVPLRKSEVNRLLGKVDELATQPESVAISFDIGESVKVVDGPFNSFTGTIEEINEDKRKLKVMVKIFGRKTPVQLNYMQVEKL
jgi:transcriptional antiterminator NusG